jgi:5,5'-dehydrodivanillate O-demethylase oxygenase subunit
MNPQEQNELLTQVGEATPMGQLLRRYWHPIAGVSELDDNPVKPVRILGEDLVLYRDLGGTYGLVDRHCPHRRADLSYGFVEQCGLRCNYHGWLYDASGQCIAQPYEDMAHPERNLKARIQVKAYPVEVKGGLVFAYLGPQPVPQLPDWDFLSRSNGFCQIVTANIPCNWLQCQENSIDPVHFEWMHANWSLRMKGKTGPYSPRHLKVDFEEFEFGLVYKRIREDTNDRDPMWTIGRVLLWPNGFYLGDHCEWRVPVDDTNTLSISWFYNEVPTDRQPFTQTTIPTWHSPIKDDASGRWIASHVINQDIIAWVGQGAIADRAKEHLATSDRGIVMMRRRLLSDLEVIQHGDDPKGIIRDPARNKRVKLPNSNRAPYGPTQQRQVASEFAFHFGQPEPVRKAYGEAMGLSPS